MYGSLLGVAGRFEKRPGPSRAFRVGPAAVFVLGAPRIAEVSPKAGPFEASRPPFSLSNGPCASKNTAVACDEMKAGGAPAPSSRRGWRFPARVLPGTSCAQLRLAVSYEDHPKLRYPQLPVE